MHSNRYLEMMPSKVVDQIVETRRGRTRVRPCTRLATQAERAAYFNTLRITERVRKVDTGKRPSDRKRTIPEGKDPVPSKEEEEIDELIGLGKTCDYGWKDVHRDPEQPIGEAKELDALLTEFADSFTPISCSFPNPKMPSYATHTIRIKPESKVVSARAYPLSSVKREVLKKMIREQLARGMIQHSSSEWASPAFLVPKPGNKWRMVIDLRRVNDCLAQESWPLPRPQEILDKLSGAKYFTSVDMSEGFFQCP